MLVVVSPAKKLDMSPEVEKIKTSKPLFSDDTDRLVKAASQLSEENLQSLMKISPALARLNKERFNNFGNQERKPAAFAFAGDTYTGFDAKSLDEDALRWAQDHMRILSGLYGLLRPLDEIEPYRLEMGSRLKVENTSDLVKKYTNREYILLFPFCSPKLKNKKWPYYKELIQKLKQEFKNKYSILLAPGPNEVNEANQSRTPNATNPHNMYTLVTIQNGFMAY